MAGAQAAKKPNWFAVGISIAVVVVLVALGGVVVWMNNQANDAGPAPVGSVIDSETGAISFGEGEDTVATYIDLMCPACNSFEQTYGEALREAASNDDITLEIHPIAILDHLSQGTDYSSRAGAAMYCVAEADADATLDYMQTLFENQPAELTGGLTDEQLIAYAEQVGAGDAAACITEGTYKKFPAAQAKAHDIKGTPTVDVNGERLDLQDQTDFQSFLDLIS